MTLLVVGRPCVALGMPVLVVRETARQPSDAGVWFRHAALLGIAFAVGILLLAYPAMVAFLPDDGLRQSLLVTLMALMPSVVTTCADSVLLGLNRVAAIPMLTLSENIVRTTLGAGALLHGDGLVSLSLAIFVAVFLQAVLAIIVLHRVGAKLTGGIQPHFVRQILAHVPVLGVIPVVNAIYARIDILFLTLLGSWTDLGIYSAARRLTDLAESPLQAYARAAYPVLSTSARGNREDYLQQARHYLGPLLVLLTLAVAYLAGLPGQLIDLLFGASLASAATVLSVIAWSILPTGLALFLARVLFSHNLQAVDLRMNTLAGMIAIGACLLLIPRYGPVGAACAVLISRLSLAGLQYRAVAHHGFPMVAKRSILYCLLLAATGAGVLRGLAPRGDMLQSLLAALMLLPLLLLASAALLTDADRTALWHRARGAFVWRRA